MEVGAVKQAFNNEVITLKKRLNQAKIQVIHKLTRKAKMLTEKKSPEQFQLKLKRKAESAVKEVLLIKKVTAKELAKFIVTHKGELKDFLNKPAIDHDKACARLLLHKVLEDKYVMLRCTYTDISIDDLFMSRDERKKIKKELKEKGKKKKNNDSNKHLKTEGGCKEEDINVDASVKDTDLTKNEDINIDATVKDSDLTKNEDIDEKCDQSSSSNANINVSIKNVDVFDDEQKCDQDQNFDDDVDNSMSSEPESLNNESSDDNEEEEEDRISEDIDSDALNKSDTFVRNSSTTAHMSVDNRVKKEKQKKSNTSSSKLSEKLLLKKMNRQAKYSTAIEQEITKIEDPFFITSTGESYMSLVEPRPPDEIKIVHRQGNRQLRRAAMFGHVPKFKPKKANYNFNNSKGFKQDQSNNKGNKSDWNEEKPFKSDKRRNLDGKKESDGRIKEGKDSVKLHPSWEAKKRQSGLLPFQGKKTVFD